MFMLWPKKILTKNLIHDREYTLQLGINLTMNTKIAQLNKIPKAANCTSPRVP